MKSIAILLFSIKAIAFDLSIVAANSKHNINLPMRVFYTDISPKINNHGDIVFQFIGLENSYAEYGIFLQKYNESRGRILEVLPKNEVISDLSFNDNGSLLYSVHDNSRTLRVVKRNINDDTNQTVFNLDDQLTTLQLSSLNEVGSFMYRDFTDNKRTLSLYDGSQVSSWLKESDFINKRQVNYIHSPELKGEYAIYKLRYGKIGSYSKSDGQELYIRNIQTGRVKLIASSRNRNPSSKLANISNHFMVNSHKEYVYLAKIDNKRVIKSNVHGIVQTLTTEGDFFKKIDSFSPTLNDNGDILVRGQFFDGYGLGLYKKDLKKWKRIKLSGRVIKLKNKIYTIVRNGQGLLLKGRPDMNNRGQIVINTYLKVKDDPRFEGIIRLDP